MTRANSRSGADGQPSAAGPSDEELADSPGTSESESGSAEAAKPTEKTEQPVETPFPWFALVAKHDDNTVIERLKEGMADLIRNAGPDFERYKIVALFDAEGSISPFTADRIFTALSEHSQRDREDVLLLLLSKGGSIEPAYQISKLCRAHAAGKFVAVVPREAKSAATLIAIGADEIHMGPLSHLGPIDPQLGGLPALGVVQALETIAALAQKFPGSWEMLSRYLQRVLTVEQIGYCQRIGESAMQYAERLLMTKSELRGVAKEIARDLVYEYKDHGFVIDLEEARSHLRGSWVLDSTPEMEFADKVYRIYEQVNLGLRFVKKKYLSFIGGVADGFMIFELSD